MKKLFSLFKPTQIVMLTLLIVSIFLRVYLYMNTSQLVREFEKQNYRELNSVDTLKISSRLSALASVINWVCIDAEANGQSFYKMTKAHCESGLIQQRYALEIPEANQLKIVFTLRLPKEVEVFFIGFFIFQIMTLLILIRSTRKNEEEKREYEIRINKISRQMSHDIRSPLAALNTIINQLTDLKSEDEVILKKSIERINAISNDLLRNKDSSIKLIPQNINSNPFSIIEEIVNEKIVEFSHLSLIEIKYEAHSTDMLVLLDPYELKRIISNIVNNCIEACKSNVKLTVIIKLYVEENNVIIEIQDNGIGISKEILKKIGQAEFTSKDYGNGLGLIHAIETIEQWNGKLQISSDLNVGTTVKIELPIRERMVIQTVLLDNDELVQITWEAIARKKGINLLIFSKPEALYEKLSELSKATYFYIDSDLGAGVRGEDVAKVIFDQGYCSIFMTSGYEAEYFTKVEWIKGVIGKAPPWN